MEDEGDQTRVSGKLNTVAIHNKIRAIPNTTYSEKNINVDNTMSAIAEGKIFVRINDGDYVNPEGFNIDSRMHTFQFQIPKISHRDIITFEFGPDRANLGSISVHGRHWVHFEPLTTQRQGAGESNNHLSNDAIIIESPSLPIGIGTESISGRIDTDMLESQLLDLNLLGLDLLKLFESQLLTPLLNLLSSQLVTLTIMDGSQAVFTDSRQLGSGYEFVFDISSVDLKAGHRIILSVESFFFKK